MSDVLPTQPPEAPPNSSRISDRAALEAALTGATALLLVRILLGRGAGLLAGTATIAARLLSTTEGQKPPAAPAKTAPDDSALSKTLALLGDLPITAEDKPDPSLSSSTFLSLRADTSGEPEISAPTISTLAEEPFAQCFTEVTPTTSVPKTQPSLTLPLSADRVSSEDEEDCKGALPAFPALPFKISTEKMLSEATQPVPETSDSLTTEVSVAATALTDLAHFPNLTKDLQHPEEIWKMAAAEATPTLAPPTVTAPVTALLLRSETAPDLLLPNQGNPFSDLLHAASSLLADSKETEDPLTTSLAKNSFTFPPITAFQKSSPLPTTPFLAPKTSEERSPHLDQTQEPPAGPTPPLPTSPILVLTEFNPSVILENTVPKLADLPFVTETPALALPAKPKRSKTWLLLLLLLLVGLLTWLYQLKMKNHATPRNADSLDTAPLPLSTPATFPSTLTSSALPSQPILTTPSPTSTGPKPDPLPPALTPPAALSASAETILYAEPYPGVPQDFPPNSLEARSRATLEKLLAANTLQEIAPLIHHPTSSLKQAAQWFPDGNTHPVQWQRILFDSSDQIPRNTFKVSFFRVVTDQIPLGFPVAVEETQNGLRIDFPAYLQCRDRLLDAFIAKPDSPHQPFYVMLRRGHYFGNDLSASQLEELICFEITAPNPGSPKHRVFIQRSSDLGRLAPRLFVWDKNYNPVVELAQVDSHVEITAIVRDTWRAP